MDKRYVLEKLSEKLRLDPDCIGFGVKNHRYELGAPIEPARLEKLEQHYGIEIPADYRQFLLTVGNGGAGPSYGLYSIESALTGKPDKTYRHPGADAGEHIKQPFEHPNDYKDLEEWPDDRGLLILCQHGCANDDFMVVTGPERGFVWQFVEWTSHHIPLLKNPPDLEHNRNLSQQEQEEAQKQWVATVLGAPDEDKMTFSDWYTNWLEKPPYILPSVKEQAEKRNWTQRKIRRFVRTRGRL